METQGRKYRKVGQTTQDTEALHGTNEINEACKEVTQNHNRF